MKTLLKKIASEMGIEIKRRPPASKIDKVISLAPERPPKGSVLLSFTLNPFLLKQNDSIPIMHTSDWDCWQIAKTFLDLDYGVDVIDYRNNNFSPTKDYAFFVDVHTNLEKIGPMLNKNCIKILHIVWAHWLSHNSGQLQRFLALRQRKGILLKPNRYHEPNFSIEHADYGVTHGGEFTIESYAYAEKPIFRIPKSTPVLYPWLEDKDYESCRNHYVWLGGRGMVHKGLDRTLEVFTGMPEYHLTICGRINREKDFEKAYYKELYQTPNIHCTGWVSMSSDTFKDVTSKSIGLIHPSCSEGGSGSVINCMHAGLIPVVSYESSVNVLDFGVILKDCSNAEIERSIREISSLPAAELKSMSRKAWEYARTNYTRENYASEYRKIIKKILASDKRALSMQ